MQIPEHAEDHVRVFIISDMSDNGYVVSELCRTDSLIQAFSTGIGGGIRGGHGTSRPGELIKI